MPEWLPEMWTTLTLAQALVLLAALYCAALFLRGVADEIRRLLGKAPWGAVEHCEHCPVVDETAARVDRLCDLVSGHIAGDEQLRVDGAAHRDAIAGQVQS